MTISDLIAALERATEGSRDLDAQIWWLCTQEGREIAEFYETPKSALSELSPREFKKFSRSLDAALSLVPTWASRELTESAAGPPTFTRCRLWDWRRSPLMIDPANEWRAEGNRPLPINICISALKALEQGKKE